MKPNKSILTNFIFVFFYTIIAWFVVIAPYSKVTDLIKQAPSWIDTNLVANYPADLNVTVKNGLVSLNKPSPYCLTLPSDSTDTNLPMGVIIDTKATPDLSALGINSKYSKLCQPYALIGENFVLYPDSSKDDNTYKYTEIPNSANFEINRSSINNFVAQYLPMVVNFGQQAYFILPFVSVLFLFLWLLSVNSWYALVVYLVAKIFKLKSSFGESFKLSLFFYNIILFVEWVLINYVLNTLLNQEISVSFFLRNTLLITVASIIYLKSRPTPPMVASVPQTPVSPPAAPTQPISNSTPTGQ